MPKKTKQERVALIDGEIIAYHAVTSREFLVETEEDGEIFQVLSFEQCKASVELRIKQILKEVGAYSCVIFFGSPENFRKKVEPSYKANRSPFKPMGYTKLKEWFEAKYNTMSLPRIEADDAMGISHTAKPEGTDETVLVSSDKDMRTIPGLLYDHTKPEKGIQDISEQEAAAFWGYQTLVGDSADGYKGCPGVGPKGAQPIMDKFSKSKLKGKRLHKAVFNEVCAYFTKAGLKRHDAWVQATLARILHYSDYDFDTQEPILWKA